MKQHSEFFQGFSRKEPFVLNVIDLTQTICPSMPVYPGTEPPRIEEATTIQKEGFAEKLLTFYSHTGTHMDAPAHLLPGKATLDSFDAAHFIGPATVGDFRKVPSATIGLKNLTPLKENLEKGGFLILHTGWSRFWGQEEYFGKYPVLTQEACQWLTRFPLQGIAMDMISIDSMDSFELENHRIILGAGMVIVENLTNLEALPEEPFTLCCLPLKIEKSDGAPVRAVGLCR
ncbi:MAG TPA: cyclase family protein [Synergistaceae bacterium]|nr:cyclase family protein [Synergistaceae bacterium]